MKPLLHVLHILDMKNLLLTVRQCDKGPTKVPISCKSVGPWPGKACQRPMNGISNKQNCDKSDSFDS
jgi:hypothetical protein